MDRDFSKPQRESAFGIIVMAAHALVKVVKAMFFPLLFILLKLKSTHAIYTLIGIALVLLLCILFAYLWYLKFTFFLDKKKQEFVVNKGILNRDQIIIQLDKIQQVNINQNILQKIIGVYGLTIDTAGAKGQEVSIKAIDEVSAYMLKEHLLDRKPEPADNQQTNREEINELQEALPFLRISNSTLFKVGLTSNYGRSLALIGIFLVYLFQEAKHIMDFFAIDKAYIKQTLLSVATLFSVAILVAAALLAFLLFNLIRTFYKYFELQIAQHKHSLILSSGLIARKNTLINPKKVQITSHSQNYFQKKLNIINMSLAQAQFGTSEKGHEMQGSTLKIVGCNPAEREEILKMILGRIPVQNRTFIPNWRFLNLPVFFKLVLPVAVFSILTLNIPELKQFQSLAVPYFLIGTLMIYISYKRHRISVSEGFIIKKSGIWDISEQIITPNKIQAITTSQYPWHKSIDVGHLCLHTSAGEIRFKYGNYTEIKKLVNYWLQQVETDQEGWM